MLDCAPLDSRFEEETLSDDLAFRAPHLYNLFPRLAGDMTCWGMHAERARGMGFDWLYLNPVHYPGFSGSCYAVKDFYRVDPLLLPEGHPDKHYDVTLRCDGGLEALGEALREMRAAGLRPVMDLVLNHTARDASWVREHPEWYVRDAQGEIQSPSAIDPADARQVTVWGDLAEIDNAGSSDRDALWDSWTRIVETYTRLGFEGFRCDAAYKVPAALWQRLIATARAQRPEALFFGETLGARLEEIEALWESGMDFVFNSSKWWAFDAPWCLEQQQAQPPHVRSISFPESHDTPRLWAETGGRESVQRQRYAFAASFATGLMMPVGYEYGFTQRIDVAATRAADWEKPNTDLTRFVRQVNEARRRVPALHGETVTAIGPLDRATLLLEKRAGEHLAWVAINKDWEIVQHLELPHEAHGARVLRVCREAPPLDESAGTGIDLEPAEALYIVPES